MPRRRKRRRSRATRRTRARVRRSCRQRWLLTGAAVGDDIEVEDMELGDDKDLAADVDDGLPDEDDDPEGLESSDDEDGKIEGLDMEADTEGMSHPSIAELG